MSILETILLILVICCFLGLAFAFRAITLQQQEIESQERSIASLKRHLGDQEERISALEEAVAESQAPSASPLAQLPVIGPMLVGQKSDWIVTIGLFAWRTIAAYLKRREASRHSQ